MPNFKVYFLHTSNKHNLYKTVFKLLTSELRINSTPTTSFKNKHYLSDTKNDLRPDYFGILFDKIYFPKIPPIF